MRKNASSKRVIFHCKTSIGFLATLLVIGNIPLIAGDVRRGDFGASSSIIEKEATKSGKKSSYPFSGELESFDSKSITLKGKRKSRTLLLTPETRVMKNGARTPLAKATPGERVSGSTRKNAEGKEQALTINLKGIAEKK